MKIFWSPLVVDRLEEIFEYISVENVSTAQKIADRILKIVESLSEYPKRGRKVLEANREETLEAFENGHKIIYRVEP